MTVENIINLIVAEIECTQSNCNVLIILKAAFKTETHVLKLVSSNLQDIRKEMIEMCIKVNTYYNYYVKSENNKRREK